jgi:ABC-type glycerol-3-phosphate transport system substrate-binding protein
MARGACRPIQDYLDNGAILKKDDIGKVYWDGASYDGKIYGVPGIEAFTRGGLCYNVGLFEDAGLDPTKPPATWNELYEAQKKLTKFDGAGNLKQLGFDPFYAEGGAMAYGDPWMIPCSWGFEYFDAATEKFNIDNADMIDGWKTYNSFYDYVGVEKIAGFRVNVSNWSDPTAPFVVGTQAIEINGYWTPGELAHVAPDKKFAFTWIPVPESRKGKRVTIFGGSMSLIFNTSKHPEEMYQFGAFLTTPKATSSIYKDLGWFSCTKEFLATVDPSVYPGLDSFVNEAKNYDEARAMEVCPVEGFLLDTWTRIREQTYYKKISVEDGVKQLQSECEKALSDLKKSV